MAIQQELQAFLLYPNETLSNEYKSWLDLDANGGKATLAKAAIALANHGGGTIIMGMRGEGEGKLQSMNRPQSMRRYSTDSVNAAINRYADPKMHYDVSFEVHPETNVEHAFIHVPASTVPVMCTRLEEKIIQQNRVYIRKAGPKSEEPTTAEEWRILLNRCVQGGRESMLDSIRIILQGHEIKPALPATDLLKEFSAESFERWQSLVSHLQANAGARLRHGHYQLSFELVGVPESSLKQMKDRLHVADQIQLTGWGPFFNIGRMPVAPHPVDNVIEAWMGYENEGLYGDYHADFWRVDPRGLLYEIRGFDEDFTNKVDPASTFDATLPIWRVGETMLYIARLSRTYEGDCQIRMRAEYSGLKGRKIDSIFERMYSIRRGQCLSERKVLEMEVGTSQIEENLGEILHSFLLPLYEQFNFSTLPIDVVNSEVRRLQKKQP